jgi:D-inositol-3-phosphate glycosyltransferase
MFGSSEITVAEHVTELPSVRRMAVIAYHSNPLVEPGAGDAGGMTVYVRALARALADRGLRTDIFTRAVHEEDRVTELSPGVRVIPIDAGPRYAVEKTRQTDFIDEFVAGVRAFTTSQRLRYDLVHSHYWQSGLAAVELAARWGVPLVHSPHSLGRVKNRWLAPGQAPEPVHRLKGETEVSAAADVLVASTDEEWNQLTCLYDVPHDRLKTLHPGVDHSIFSPGSKSAARSRTGLDAPTGGDEDPAILLYVGRIQPLKGVELAIRATEQLVPVLERPVKLIAVGGASGNEGAHELRRLEELARSLGVTEAVEFAGPKPHHELVHYYRAADALAVCSYSESFGLAALEAHACGTPVVATSVGGLSRIVADGESGFIVESRDPAEFAGRLKTMLADEILRARMRAAASNRSQMFTWDATADEFLELYECLVREDYPEACTC